MKTVYVSDLKPNQEATSLFLVQSKAVRQKKSGEPYLALTLADKTGPIEAKMWDNVGEVMDTFERDDFIKAKGRVQVYHNKPQFTIHKLVRMDPSEVRFADFFPASNRDPEEMMTELRGLIASVGNPHLRALLEAVFGDEEISSRFMRAPAAKSVHHAYLGGLIEHVLSLAKICDVAAAHYEIIDRDLLLSGAILHDVGKIHELSYERSFGYTDDGQLLGHIIIGLRIIEDKLRGLPDFPPRLRTLVEHMLIAHHGELEFGSPKVPMFAEALLLHMLDNVESKMENIRATIEHDQQIDGVWTAYNYPLERTILKKRLFLEDSAAPSESRAETKATPKPRSPENNPQSSLFGDKLQSALRKES